MFKKTKTSLTTLQANLKHISEIGFFKRGNIGHMNVDYTIADREEKLLRNSEEL